MPFQNVPTQIPAQPANALAPLMAMMLQKRLGETPPNQVDPNQMQAMGQNQIPLGPQQGQMNPQQFMQAGLGSSSIGG